MSLSVEIEKNLGSFHLRAAFEAGDETLALLGASGCGKSMTLNCIAGVERPDRGRIVVDGRTVFDVERLSELARRLQVRMGIICVPAAYAQEVADRMVAGGIRAIWNFANVSLSVPDDVIVQREVIAGGLAVLSVKMSRKLAGEDEPGQLG